MPRKRARPAYQKRQERMKAKMAKKSQFDTKAKPIRANPRHGDGILLAALAAGLFKEST